jgi:hypothetical protein
MYYHGRPIYTIPEYIYRKMKASANIYIIEYAEAFIFQIHPLAFYLRFLFVTGACMPISRPKLEVHYVLSWPAIPEYIPVMGASSNFYVIEYGVTPISHMPGYILSKMVSSSIILYIDYEEDTIFRYKFNYLSFTILLPTCYPSFCIH